MPLIPLAIVLATALVVIVRARGRAHARKRKPAKEPSAFVLLDGNQWEACTIDGLREPWSRYTTEPVRGFCGVRAGRHRIRTATVGGDATLDFVIYPGEVLAFRLELERARWVPHELDGDTRGNLEAAPVSSTDVASAGKVKLPGSLVHLRTTTELVGSRRNAPPAKADDDGAVDRIRKRLAKLVARAESESEDQDALLTAARSLGDALVGVQLTRRDMRSLAGVVRSAAERLTARGEAHTAVRVLSLGFAVMPGDPELMVALGCTLAVRGEVDEAMRALDAALERDRCLEAEDVALAMRARLELRSRLGRSVRV